jgi:hypothetical protein
MVFMDTFFAKDLTFPENFVVYLKDIIVFGILRHRSCTLPKTLYRKTVRINVDDDILTKQNFPRVHTDRERIGNRFVH